MREEKAENMNRKERCEEAEGKWKNLMYIMKTIDHTEPIKSLEHGKYK
jgi:hypothetical protein